MARETESSPGDVDPPIHFFLLSPLARRRNRAGFAIVVASAEEGARKTRRSGNLAEFFAESPLRGSGTADQGGGRSVSIHVGHQNQKSARPKAVVSAVNGLSAF